MATLLKIAGVHAARAKAGERAVRIADMRAANKKAAIVIYGWVMRNMEAEGRLQDVHWPPLKAATIAARARKGYWPGKMLQVTGQMKQRFIPSSTNRQARVGNSAPYAKYHDEGTSRIPARRMLPRPQIALEMVRPIYGAAVKLAVR